MSFKAMGKTGTLLANAPYSQPSRFIQITEGTFCCDTDVELCDYTANTDVTAAETILGIQYTFKGVQGVYSFNNGAGIHVPAGGSAATTEIVRQTFVDFLKLYLVDAGNANVTFAANTLTFTATSNDQFVLDNVVLIAGADAFAASNCETF